MKIHELKTDPEYFEAVWNSWKTLEIRYDDRDYKVGDLLFLQKTQYTGKQMLEGQPLVYIGISLLCKIPHIQKDIGLREGWVALSIKILDKSFEHNE